MERITKLLGLFTLSWVFAAPGYGQDLLTIMQLALDNDPTLRQAQATYRANRENLTQARATLLPSLGANATTTRLTSGPADDIVVTDPVSGRRVVVAKEHSFANGVNNNNWGARLTQSVFNLANWYNLQSAKATDRANAVNLAAQEQDLIVRVAFAYFDVLRATDLLETNIQEEEAALRSLEQTQQREEVGLVAITDVFDAQAAYDLARNTTILQRDALRAAYEALEAITGQPHPGIESLSEEFPIVNAEGTLDEWEDQAMDNSLALESAKFNFEAARKNLAARRSDHLPTIDVTGQYGVFVTAPIQDQGIQIGGGAFERSALALSVTVPIFQGGAVNSRRRAAEYNVVAAQESLELTRRQLTQNIRNAYRRVNTSVLVVDQRQQSITSAESALEATELGAEVGTRNIVEVLRARENLFRALRAYAEARYDYVLNTMTLKQVAGILTPQDVIELNEWLQ